MSTYALLGATGQIGNCILETLAENPDTKIHALVRSSSKLKQMSPDIYTSPNLKIFEASISNIDVLKQCITGTRAVFLAVAERVNRPGTRIASDQSEAVVAALEAIREENPSVKLPTLVMISSAETSEKLSGNLPWLVYRVLFASNFHIYTDLIAAEEYLRKRGDWISSVFVKPGGLSRDIRRGHVLSTEEQQTFVSYLDLAAGMAEIAEDGDGKWDGKDVSVLSKGNAKFEWMAPVMLSKGLLFYLCPWLCQYLA